jgi:UDP-sulfoquinovose synthase
MKVFILGGDGFCGWPTALYLSKLGYEVVIIDNLSRRKIDLELEVNSLTPISYIGERLSTWKSITGNTIKFSNIDISDQYVDLLDLILLEKPDSIVHFAEQSSAPLSMKNSKNKRYTVNNNLNATNNLLAAVVESGLDIHIVHLGSMGVYGYSSVEMKIPEGYLKIHLKDDNEDLIEKEIMYPPNPGSLYHMTKTQDALMFAFYNSNNNIRITDLHQGIVWGSQTNETSLDERLINKFSYDGDYGTVLNRFLMQAAIGHPLTVHGSGGQTRAFIHIKDTVKCIEIAIKNPPDNKEKVKVFNQMTETHNIKDLAVMISNKTGVDINYIKNPRNEDSENNLHVDNQCFLELGLIPTTLNEGLMDEITHIVKKYSYRCDRSKIICKSYWTSSNKV